jgi:hypothetical protein
MPVDIRASIQSALKQLNTDRSRLDSQISALTAALASLGVKGGNPSSAKRATRRRPKMTPAQRKAVSARMKKYWARRKKAQG